MSESERGLADNRRDIAQSELISTHLLNHPDELFAAINRGRVLVTIAPYGWATYIRSERLNQYAVRYVSEHGDLSGTLRVDHRTAHRLVGEKWREAIWWTLRPGRAWPTAECMEVEA